MKAEIDSFFMGEKGRRRGFENTFTLTAFLFCLLFCSTVYAYDRYLSHPYTKKQAKHDCIFFEGFFSLNLREEKLIEKQYVSVSSHLRFTKTSFFASLQVRLTNVYQVSEEAYPLLCVMGKLGSRKEAFLGGGLASSSTHKCIATFTTQQFNLSPISQPSSCIPALSAAPREFLNKRTLYSEKFCQFFRCATSSQMSL